MITKNPMTALERRSVASLAALYSVRMLGLFMVLPLLALYTADIAGATPARIGLALGIYGLTQALLQIPLGWLSDRIGRRRVIVGGLLIFALGSVVAATADTIGGIIFGRALQGMGAIAGTVMALVADSTREEQRTKAMALVGISIGASFALALVLGPLVASWGGLSAVFYLTALLAVTGIGIVWLRLPAPQSGGIAPTTRSGSVLDSLLEPALARLNFGIFVLHFILMACFLAVPALIETVAGVPREQHWLVYLPILLLSVLGMLPLMRMAERGGRPRAMFAVGIAMLMFALALVGVATAPGWFYLGLWLFFVGFNYLEASLPSLVSKTAGADTRGAAMGVYSSCQFMGAFAGGAGGGWLLQHYGLAALLGVSVLLAAVWLFSTLTLKPIDFLGREQLADS